MIDVQMKSSTYTIEKMLTLQLRPVFYLSRDIFLASVYDAIIVLRPSINFRDGLVIKNQIQKQNRYFLELPFHDGYLLRLIHLIPFNLSHTFHTITQETTIYKIFY